MTVNSQTGENPICANILFIRSPKKWKGTKLKSGRQRIEMKMLNNILILPSEQRPSYTSAG